MKRKQILFSVAEKDFDVQTFRSGGPGGQNQNKVESGVRIVHRTSGAAGVAETQGSASEQEGSIQAVDSDRQVQGVAAYPDCGQYKRNSGH